MILVDMNVVYDIYGIQMNCILCGWIDFKIIMWKTQRTQLQSHYVWLYWILFIHNWMRVTEIGRLFWRRLFWGKTMSITKISISRIIIHFVWFWLAAFWDHISREPLKTELSIAHVSHYLQIISSVCSHHKIRPKQNTFLFFSLKVVYIR